MSISEGAMAHCVLPMGLRTIQHRDLGLLRHLMWKLVLCGDPHSAERLSANVTPRALSFPRAKAKKESPLTKPNCASGDFLGTAVRRARASNNYCKETSRTRLTKEPLGPMWSLGTRPKRDGANCSWVQGGV